MADSYVLLQKGMWRLLPSLWLSTTAPSAGQAEGRKAEAVSASAAACGKKKQFHQACTPGKL